MCYILTAHVAVKECNSSFWDICKKHQLLQKRCSFPRGLSKRLKKQGICSFFFTGSGCDCNTGIGADRFAKETPEQAIARVYNSINALLPSPERDEVLKEYTDPVLREEWLRRRRQEDLETRRTQEDELANYVTFLQALRGCGVSRFCLLKHWDDGKALDGNISMEIIPIDAVDISVLFAMKEDTIYAFQFAQTVADQKKG